MKGALGKNIDMLHNYCTPKSLRSNSIYHFNILADWNLWNRDCPDTSHCCYGYNNSICCVF